MKNYRHFDEERGEILNAVYGAYIRFLSTFEMTKLFCWYDQSRKSKCSIFIPESLTT
jgi:hypothetical protein